MKREPSSYVACCAALAVIAGLLWYSTALGQNASDNQTDEANRRNHVLNYKLLSPEAGSETADAENSIIPPWIVMPVTTELQRVRAGKDTMAYVIVNGEMFEGGSRELESQVLKSDLLVKQLDRFPKSDSAAVHFHLRCSDKGLPNALDRYSKVDLVRNLLLELAKDIGITEATAKIYFHAIDDTADEWDALMKRLLNDRHRASAQTQPKRDVPILEEPAKGNNPRFNVYPVRTQLSRFMFGGADCVLHILPNGGVGPSEAADLEQSIEKLDLNRRRKICFLCPTLVGNWYVNKPEVYKKRLGFETKYESIEVAK